MSAHTPGPWHVEAPSDGRVPRIRAAAPVHALVALCGGTSTKASPRVLANARVIASAPLLLAACEGASADMERVAAALERESDHPLQIPLYAAAAALRRTIAAATGQEA